MRLGSCDHSHMVTIVTWSSIMVTSHHAKVVTWCSSWMRRMKLSLSCSAPPRLPGYSQSRSRPSKLWRLMKPRAERAKVRLCRGLYCAVLYCTVLYLCWGLAAIRLYFSLPSFQPPMARVTCSTVQYSTVQYSTG